MAEHIGPTAVRLDITFASTAAGARASRVGGLGEYRPHLRVDGGVALGAGLWFQDSDESQKRSAVALLPFDVDYRPLVISASCEILEGDTVVGNAVVVERWESALTLHHETHRLGVAVLSLVDDGMGVWRGPFLPWAGYDRVRSIFRRFAEASDALSAPAEDARRRYFEERDSLGLRLSTWPEGGRASAEWIHILDFSDITDVEVEIQGLSAEPV